VLQQRPPPPLRRLRRPALAPRLSRACGHTWLQPLGGGSVPRASGTSVESITAAVVVAGEADAANGTHALAPRSAAFCRSCGCRLAGMSSALVQAVWTFQGLGLRSGQALTAASGVKAWQRMPQGCMIAPAQPASSREVSLQGCSCSRLSLLQQAVWDATPASMFVCCDFVAWRLCRILL
jgi:hypothetical protein